MPPGCTPERVSSRTRTTRSCNWPGVTYGVTSTLNDELPPQWRPTGRPSMKTSALVIDPAEVEQDALAVPARGHGDRAVIPHHLDEVPMPDAGEPALRAERHQDLVREPLAVVVALLEARIGSSRSGRSTGR